MPNLVTGISEKSFEDAMEDAKIKLYQIPDLPYSNKPDGIKICLETYKYQHKHNQTTHIFL